MNTRVVISGGKVSRNVGRPGISDTVHRKTVALLNQLLSSYHATCEPSATVQFSRPVPPHPVRSAGPLCSQQLATQLSRAKRGKSFRWAETVRSNFTEWNISDIRGVPNASPFSLPALQQCKIPVFVTFVLILCNMALRITVQGHDASADCHHFKAQSLLCVGQQYSRADCTHSSYTRYVQHKRHHTRWTFLKLLGPKLCFF